MLYRLSLLKYVSCFAITQGIFLGSVSAQVIPDGTTTTTVNVNGNDLTIEQGDRAGDNLFHSFSDFSIPTNGSALFNNSADIVNIFSRVTGGNISNIDGVLGANGTANLYLINPAGIIFGEGARLDIGGSFFGSTADSIIFPEGELSAIDLTNPPLLTINAPIGLSFRDNPGDIVNRSDLRETNTINQGTELERNVIDRIGLQVNPGNNFTLVGGNIFLQDSGIVAPGGTVNLGGLSVAGEVGINSDDSLAFPNSVTRADVSLSEGAVVNVRAGGDGFINVNVSNLTLTGQSELFAGIAENMGSPEAQAGDININATDSVRIIGQISQTSFNTFSNEEVDRVFTERDTSTAIRNNLGLSSARRLDGSDRSSAIGSAGDINIETNILELQNVSFIDSSTFGTGNGGDININSQSITVNGFNALIESKVRGISLNLIQEFAIGDAGNINIFTEFLSLNDSEVNTSVLPNSQGNAGNININSGAIIIGNSSQIAAQIVGQGTGNSGDININTRTFTSRGSRLQTDNQGTGNAGNITVNATDFVSLDSIDQTIDGRLSLIIAQLQRNVVGEGGDINITAPLISLNNFSLISTNIAEGSVGEAGDITLNADTIELNNGSVIDALTETDFDGGDISINANFLELRNGSKIVTGADKSGNAGTIDINISGDIILNNSNPPDNSPFDEPNLQDIELQTGIFANNFPNSTGNGGTINILADSIQFENQGSILVETVSGEGGFINLRVNDLISLRNNGQISAEAGGTGNGGNININTNFIVATPNQNNDIVANALGGNGGRINISAEALFGIQERPLNEVTNDINASSNFGLDGSIAIFTPDINSVKTDINLPNSPVDSEQTVAQACEAGRTSGKPRGLTIKGKGGVPSIPTQILNAETILVEELINNSNIQTQYPEIKPIATTIGKIYPARGILKTEDGKILLTAHTTNNHDHRTSYISLNCNAS